MLGFARGTAGGRRGAPSRSSARRMISTVSRVFLLRGCGEKITASRHLMAKMPLPGASARGWWSGTSEAISPTGLPYLTMPFSGISSMTPTLFWRSRSRRMPMILKRLPMRLSGSPMPLSSTPICASRVNVARWPPPRPRPGRGDPPLLRGALELGSAARPRATSSSTCDGYARAAGRPGVVILHVGPGVTNAATGVATAAFDSVPLAGDCRRRAQPTTRVAGRTRSSTCAATPTSVAVRALRQARLARAEDRSGAAHPGACLGPRPPAGPVRCWSRCRWTSWPRPSTPVVSPSPRGSGRR
jgi:hypothetical protein